MNQMTFYTNPESRSVVVEWLLAELEIDCTRVTLDYGTSMKAPEYLAINPFGKVPALIDGDLVIYETAAICAYLADKYSDKGLAPALDDPKRGLYYRWLFLAAGPWEAANVDRLLKVAIAPEQEMFVGYGNYNTLYQAVIKGLTEAQPYLCGAQFTAADVYVGAGILWELKMGTLQPHPEILRYVDNLRLRPSLQTIAATFS